MPARDDVPVTKAELKSELASLEQRLTSNFDGKLSATEQRLDERLAATEQRFDEKLAATEQRLDNKITAAFREQRDYIDERTRDLQTELLRAFEGFQHAQDIRFRHLAADVSNIRTGTEDRLAALEARVSEIDRRLIVHGI